MIYQIAQYTDDEGKLVTARIPVDAETLVPDLAKAKFFGTYTIPHPQLGSMRFEFEFPEDWKLTKCFDKFKEEAQKDFTSQQEEAQKVAKEPKLWTPNSGEKDSVIMPK